MVMTQKEYDKHLCELVKSLIDKKYSQDMIEAVANLMLILTKPNLEKAVVEFEAIVEKSKNEEEAYSKISKRIKEMKNY